jgi:hypothetical protein
MVPIGGRPVLKQGVCFRRTFDPCGETHPDKKRHWLLKAGVIHGLNLLSTMARLEWIGWRPLPKIRFQADVPVATSFFVRRRAVSFDSLPRAT